MANVKFSDFAVRTTVPTVDYIVGYQGAANIQIAPTDFLGDYLPLAGGTMIGDVVYNDSVKAKFGTGADSELYHTGSHLFLDNVIGTSYIRNTAAGGAGILLRNSTIGDIQFDNEFAGNILFNTSNVERMRIDLDGNVGIGAAASDGNFQVKKAGVNTGITNVLINASFSEAAGSLSGLSIGYRTDETTAVLAPRTATGNLAFYSYDGGWSESMRITNTGNVGIGTASPLANLDVSNTAGTTYQQWSYDNPGANDYNLTLSETVTAGNVRFCFNQRNAGTTYSDVLVFNQGQIGIGTDSPTQKLHSYITTGDIYNLIETGSNVSTAGSRYKSSAQEYFAGLQYSTTNAYQIYDITNSLTRLTILNDGNVGIGTVAPTAKLQLESTSAGAATVAGFLVNSSTTLNTETRLAFAAHTNSDIATNRYSYISTINSTGSNGQDMVFATNATGAGGTEKMRIDSAGQVNLLNTTSTDSKHFGITNAAGTTGWTFGNGVIANSHQFVIYDNTAGATRMLIDSSGDIGIGGTPASKLDVHAASGDGIRVANTTSAAYNSDLIVNFNDLQAGNTGNTVLSTRTDKDIDIDPNGTGVINLKSNIAITGAYTDQNGVRTFSQGGTMVNNVSYNIDITVDDDSGIGTVHHITAMMTHFSTTYGCVLDCYAYTRATSVDVQTDLLNQSTAGAGGWTVSKPDTTTLRLTKSAGTYTGGGNYQVVVVTRTP